MKQKLKDLANSDTGKMINEMIGYMENMIATMVVLITAYN